MLPSQIHFKLSMKNDLVKSKKTSPDISVDFSLGAGVQSPSALTHKVMGGLISYGLIYP